MGKTVCHVTSAHLPFDGRIFERECTSLAKQYDVFLIVPNIEDCVRNNVHVLGVSIPSSRIKRLLNLKLIYKRMLEVDADVYHIHEPELIPYALRLKKRGKKIVFDSHENIPGTILRMDYLPHFIRALGSRLYSTYEKRVLKRFDAVVSVTPEIVQRLSMSNPCSYMITNFPIYREVYSERTWENKIVFAGAISSNWNFPIILKAIENLDVTFELIGPVSNDYLNYLRSLPGWSKVNFRGRLPHQDVLKIIGTCTAGFALESYDNPNAGGKKGSIGVTKMFEYMQEGIPVIATDLDNWVPIVEGTESGYCTNPYNSTLLKEKLKFLLSNKDEAKRMGDNGRKAVREKYCWQTQEKTLFEMYEKVLAE